MIAHQHNAYVLPFGVIWEVLTQLFATAGTALLILPIESNDPISWSSSLVFLCATFLAAFLFQATLRIRLYVVLVPFLSCMYIIL